MKCMQSIGALMERKLHLVAKIECSEYGGIESILKLINLFIISLSLSLYQDVKITRACTILNGINVIKSPNVHIALTSFWSFIPMIAERVTHITLWEMFLSATPFLIML